MEAFVSARLLVAGIGPQPNISVAHDALFTRWPILKEWIESRRDDLVLMKQVRWLSREWEASGRSPALLRPHEWLITLQPMLDRLKPNDLSDVEWAYIRPEADRLQDELRDLATDHMRRAEIGDRMARIGDRRPGVGLRPDGLPLIEWCLVSSGVTTISDEPDHLDQDPFERTFEIVEFNVAKHPVTWQQFSAFVLAEDGYDCSSWWIDISKQPKPPNQFRPIGNHPADNVAWDDAVAFCRWLTVRLRSIGELLDDEEVRLPTEWEWQLAAMDAHQSREFPWGPEWDPRRANTRESRLGRSVAVGMYPEGASHCGALDMSGNVSEWCLNQSREPLETVILGDAPRAIRGGAWGDEHLVTQVVTRSNSPPHRQSDFIGFRVCGPSSIHDRVCIKATEPS